MACHPDQTGSRFGLARDHGKACKSGSQPDTQDHHNLQQWKCPGRSRARAAPQRHRKVMDFCLYHGIQSIFACNLDGVRRGAKGTLSQPAMSQWEYGKEVDYLIQKREQTHIGCFTGDERGRPCCCSEGGHRHKPKGRNGRGQK